MVDGLLMKLPSFPRRNKAQAPKVTTESEKVQVEEKIGRIDQRLQRLRTESRVLTIRIPKQKRQQAG